MAQSKIIYIHGSPIPLFDQANNFHALNMCQAYRQESYDVTLMAVRAPDFPEHPHELEEIWTKFDIRDPFKLLLFHSFAPFHRFRFYDASVRMAFEARTFSGVRIHTRNITSALWGMKLGIPVILELHAPPSGKLNRFQARQAFRHPKLIKVITNSSGLKRILLESYGDTLQPDQVQPEPNAIDPERFESLPDRTAIRQHLNIPSDDFVVVYAGSMYAGRGIELLIEIGKQLPDISFLLLGGESAQVDQFRHDTEHLPNLQFLGHQSGQVIPHYLKAADILVMPYQYQIAVANTWTENSASYASPVKMFEYLAAGQFIISSDLPVIHEILDEQTATFCKPDDVDEWVATIKKARETPTWRLQLAQNAESKAQNYTWRKRVQRINQGI